MKDNDLFTVPFDKGNGFCVMFKQDYFKKIDDLLKLPQFEIYSPKSNERVHTSMVTEDRFNRALHKLITVVDNDFIGPLAKNMVRRHFFNNLTGTGSHLPKLYGLAKVHKDGVPLRPVISFPGSAYHNLAKYLSKILKPIKESQINCSVNDVINDLNDLSPNVLSNKVLASFDVVSLFTNVPVMESIKLAVDLACEHYGDSLMFDKATLQDLFALCTKNIVFTAKGEAFCQVDGVAMASPLGPLLANIYMCHVEKSL